MVAAGLRGRKNGTGSGFYEYTEGKEHPNPALASLAPGTPAPAMDDKGIQDRLNGVLIAETRRVLAEGVVKTEGEADLALLLGAGFPAVRGGALR
jgi:3-hydroxyacyl-CoA dehydrogenase